MKLSVGMLVFDKVSKVRFRVVDVSGHEVVLRRMMLMKALVPGSMRWVDDSESEPETYLRGNFNALFQEASGDRFPQ